MNVGGAKSAGLGMLHGKKKRLEAQMEEEREEEQNFKVSRAHHHSPFSVTVNGKIRSLPTAPTSIDTFSYSIAVELV